MPDFKLTLHIDKIGDLEALNALNALDAKGRRIIEGVSGATGRAMGEVALAYERGSKSMRLSLEQVAKEHEKNIAAMVREERAADALGRRQGLATLSATRGVEQLARSASLVGSSLDQTISQVSQLAFGFGTTGPLVGAIGVATVAIVELFKHTRDEMRRVAAEAAKEFDSIAHRDVRGQGEAASLLYSGDPFNFQTDESGRPALARFGLEELRRQRAMYDRQRRQVITGAGTGGGAAYVSQETKDAEALFKKIDAEIQQREARLQTILGPGGTMQLAAQRALSSDMAGFVTEDLKADAKADKAFERLAKKNAATYKRELAHDMKDATKLAVQQAMEAAAPSVEARHQITKGIYGDVDALSKQIADDMKEAIRMASDMVAHDPMVIKANLGDELGKQLSQSLRDGIAGGLASSIEEAIQGAFSGGGASGFIENFGRAILKALGGLMEQMGATLISFGVAMTLVNHALKNPLTSGPALIAAGALLVGLGAALDAAVRGGGAGHASSGGGYGGGSGLASIVDRGIISPDTYSTRSASSITPRPGGDTFVFYGANDPQAVRWLDEMDRKRRQRGSLAGAFA